MVTIEEVMENDEMMMGYCTECEDWTRDCCEPDAREYDCPDCEENTVYGAQELLIMGLVG